MAENIEFKSGYSAVNGLKMYYEIHGWGKPLVLIHGGGSTMHTSFGKIIPQLAAKRQIIAVDMQAHGHTNDRDTDLTFEQDARDVATFLSNLNIPTTDVLGFSNGAHTTIELALRYPELINKMILASTFYKRGGAFPGFWDGFNHATLNDMPQVLRDAYLEANNDAGDLLNMFNKDVQRMKAFRGWTDEEINGIKVPTLIINGNRDVADPEHAVEMYRAFPNSELAIFPGGHGTYLGTLESVHNEKWPQFNAVSLIEEFLNKQ